jgi:hypothetical protein
LRRWLKISISGLSRIWCTFLWKLLEEGFFRLY